MTAMIDIVFQLLVFFIMTFKITAMEADFNIRMPIASKTPPEEQFDVNPQVIFVNLRAGAERGLAGIDVEYNLTSKSFDDKNMYSQLTSFVEESITTEGDPSSDEEFEVEFTIAQELKYGFTVQAIEAVSGKIVNGKIKTLIEKIKFRNNAE